MSLTRIGSIGINTGIAFAGVTTIVTLNTANDALSIGATVNVGSGITLGASGDIFATGVSTFSGNLKVGSGVTISPDGDGFYTGVVTATTFSGALAASNLTGALPAISGANLTNLDASDLASGTVPTARLGSGTASSSTFLRGDSTFATVTSTTINSNTNNYLITGTGTSDTLQGESGLTYDGDTLTSDAAMRNIQAGSNYVLIGSSDAGGVTLGLDGDSNGDGAGVDYAFIEHNTDGDLIICGDNPANASNIIFKTNSSTERLRIASGGNIGIGDRTTSPDELLHVHTSSGEAKIHVEAATNARVRIRAHSGESIVQFADAASSNPGEVNYAHSSNSMSFRTNGNARVTINSDGIMTKTHHPSFSAHTTSTTTANSNVVFDAAVTAIGSHYSTSTGRFTAPVAGNYYFSFYGMGPHANSTNPRCYFKINGAAHGSGQMYGGVAYAGAHSGGYTHMSMDTVLPLSANDYVQVYWQNINLHAEHCKFNGFLIG